MDTFANFETERASRYLATLCKHFGRKVETQNDATKGWVQFPFGRCDLTASKSRLELRVSAEDQRQLDQVTNIITSHLERFAFRENPTLDWRKASPNN